MPGSTAAAEALLPFLLLSTAFSAASYAESLRCVITEAGFRPRDALPSTADPCLISGISCDLTRRAISISLRSLRFPGSISPHVGCLTDLRELSLPDNRLSGPLPAELSLCSNLEVLNIRNNRLSGEVPLEISSLTSLRALDLSSNRLVGDLRFLVHFPNLENLSLANNLFSGHIPASLSPFPNLLSVDLSGNPGLDGDVSPLTPRRRSLLPFIILAQKGSPKTSTSSLQSDTTGAAPEAAPAFSTSTPQHHDGTRKHRFRKWITGFFIGSIAGILTGLIVSILFRLILNCIHGHYHNPGGARIFSPIIRNKEDLAFLKKNDGLADLKVIGRGGSGDVYRKDLHASAGGGGSGKMIAIKKIRKVVAETGDDPITEEESGILDKRMRQIRSEIRTVSRIRHRNLLPLLAHVSSSDCHYLIYEYMKNGSLHDALREAWEGRRELGWPARHRIAMGIAAGLEHLHVHHRPTIIHRDLKPGNVLLDEGMEARITDFGFAKEVPDSNTHMTTSNVAGTLGYIAPEYYQTMKYTAMCDIYSFGVMLGVMVVGRFPSDDFFLETEEFGLVKWMRNKVREGKVGECFDRRLAGRGHDEQLELVLRVACFCTADDPKARPSIKEVRLMLAQIGSDTERVS